MTTTIVLTDDYCPCCNKLLTHHSLEIKGEKGEFTKTTLYCKTKKCTVKQVIILKRTKIIFREKGRSTEKPNSLPSTVQQAVGLEQYGKPERK